MQHVIATTQRHAAKRRRLKTMKAADSAAPFSSKTPYRSCRRRRRRRQTFSLPCLCLSSQVSLCLLVKWFCLLVFFCLFCLLPCHFLPFCHYNSLFLGGGASTSSQWPPNTAEARQHVGGPIFSPVNLSDATTASSGSEDHSYAAPSSSTQQIVVVHPPPPQQQPNKRKKAKDGRGPTKRGPAAAPTRARSPFSTINQEQYSALVQTVELQQRQQRQHDEQLRQQQSVDSRDQMPPPPPPSVPMQVKKPNKSRAKLT